MRLEYPHNVRVVRMPCTGKVDIVHLLEADILFGKHMADVDPVGVPADTTIAADVTNLVVGGIFNLGNFLGVGSARWIVE
jgi:hypothetical protein